MHGAKYTAVCYSLLVHCQYVLVACCVLKTVLNRSDTVLVPPPEFTVQAVTKETMQKLLLAPKVVPEEAILAFIFLIFKSLRPRPAGNAAQQAKQLAHYLSQDPLAPELA